MLKKWQNCTWGDLATLEYGKGLRGYENATGSCPVYGTNGPIGFHTEPLCPHPGVIIGRKGAYRGVHFSPKPFYVIDTAFYLKPKTEFDIKWAYYELLTHDINSMDSGSAIPSTSRDTFYALPVKVPPLDEQKEIAYILGTLDDKIELNQQMNRTLEGIARALFKSWFIDFDPVRAKLDGRQPAGMDAETAALFPDSFEDSPLGKIPKGWKVGDLSDIAEVIMGASPKGDTYNEEGIGTPLVNGPVEFGDHFLIKRKWTTAPTRLSQAGDLIFCVRGSTTGRRVIADDVFCLGRGVCAIRSRSGKQSFINQTVNLEIDRLLAKTTGSVFPNLGSKDIKEFQVLVPLEPVVKRYCTICSNLDSKIYSQVRESIALSSMRDSLLPKLLSGETRVNDAEQALEAVA